MMEPNRWILDARNSYINLVQSKLEEITRQEERQHEPRRLSRGAAVRGRTASAPKNDATRSRSERHRSASRTKRKASTSTQAKGTRTRSNSKTRPPAAAAARTADKKHAPEPEWAPGGMRTAVLPRRSAKPSTLPLAPQGHGLSCSSSGAASLPSRPTHRTSSKKRYHKKSSSRGTHGVSSTTSNQSSRSTNTAEYARLQTLLQFSEDVGELLHVMDRAQSAAAGTESEGLNTTLEEAAKEAAPHEDEAVEIGSRVPPPPQRTAKAKDDAGTPAATLCHPPLLSQHQHQHRQHQHYYPYLPPNYACYPHPALVAQQHFTQHLPPPPAASQNSAT